MLLTIAILSGIGLIASFLNFMAEDKISVNPLFVAIFCISVWNSCLTLAIIAIVFALITALIGSARENH